MLANRQRTIEQDDAEFVPPHARKDIMTAQAMADKMEGVSLTIGAKTSTTGTIFGSVTNIQIAEALKEKGFEVDRKLILIKDQVKEVGTYNAVIKLHKEVSVDVPFEVVAE